MILNQFFVKHIMQNNWILIKILFYTHTHTQSNVKNIYKKIYDIESVQYTKKIQIVKIKKIVTNPEDTIV